MCRAVLILNPLLVFSNAMEIRNIYGFLQLYRNQPKGKVEISPSCWKAVWEPQEIPKHGSMLLSASVTRMTRPHCIIEEGKYAYKCSKNN